jgi:hypothetical protein
MSRILGMSAHGYQQTLEAPRREVCFLLVSGHADREIREARDLGLLSARKRTSETVSLDVSF